MKDNCFVDTNILVYFRDASEPEKQKTAGNWLETVWKNRTGRISFQVLNEYYVIVTQKLKPGMTQVNARLDGRKRMPFKSYRNGSQLPSPIRGSSFSRVKYTRNRGSCLSSV